MIKFSSKYFQKFNFSQGQIRKFLQAAYRDLNIAKQVDIPEVKFQFAYNALIKLGITAISCFDYRVKSRSGHHVKILEKASLILANKDIKSIGNKMRKTRNTDIYGGGILMSDKQANRYLDFMESVFHSSENFFKNKLGRLL